MVKTFSFQIEKKLLLKIDFSSDSFQNCPHKMCDQFLFSFPNAFFTVIINGGHCNLFCIYFAIDEEGTLEGPIYNITTSNPSWHLATDFLCGASVNFLKLACLSAHHCQGIRFTCFQNSQPGLQAGCDEEF